MMNMCAVAGLCSACSLGMRSAAPEMRCRAEASQVGSPEISAPMRSAAYSRLRLIAICTSMAAMGARIMMAIEPMMPSGLLRLSDEPPKNMAKFASMPMAPASVAVIVMIRVSRFFTWASSCAITPAISSRLRLCSRPVVAATAAFSGLRPVAKALGWSLSIT